MKRIVIAVVLLLGISCVVAPAAYLVANLYVNDAMAQGASEERDAGVRSDTSAATPGEAIAKHGMVDPVADPSGAVDTLREWYAKGGLTFVVLVLIMVASAVYMRMKPGDSDGDGLPDVGGGWRDRTWAISGAVVMAGFPLLDKMTGVVGVNWSGVLVGAAGAAALLMSNRNPVRGLKTK